MTIYAVKKGHNLGVFDNLVDLEKSISNFNDPEFQSFESIEEAVYYLNEIFSISYDENNIVIKLGDEEHKIPFNSTDISEKIRHLTNNTYLQSEILEKIELVLNNRTKMNINGVEDTECNDSLDTYDMRSYNPDHIKYIVKTFTVGTLNEYITGFDGEEVPTIIMDPTFQRKFVWSNKAKSSLIESMLLNIPIPSIYLNETQQNSYIPADGLQRLNAINEFLSGKLKLSGLEYLIQFNGYKFMAINSKDKSPILPLDVRRRIRDYAVNCNIIDSLTPDKVKLDIFRRLNTTGVNLSSQELRNSITTEPVRKLYRYIEDDINFQDTVMNFVNTNRFIHHEFILRFIGFYLWQVKRVPDLSYNGDVQSFLDEVLIYLKFIITKEECNEIIEKFLACLEKANVLLGKDAFKKTSPSSRKGTINTVLFSQILINLLDANVSTQQENGFLKAKFDEFMRKNTELWFAVSYATNSKKNIYIANDQIKNFFSKEGLYD